MTSLWKPYRWEVILVNLVLYGVKKEQFFIKWLSISFVLCEGWCLIHSAPSCQYELLSDWHSWGVLTPHIFQTSDIADRLRQDLCVWFNENKPFKTKTLPLYIMWLMIYNTQKLWVRKIKGRKSIFHLAVLTQFHLPPDKKLHMTDSGFPWHTHILPLKGLEGENIIRILKKW